MRFTVTGEWKTNRLLQLVIAFFLLFAILLWVSNLLLFKAHLSFDTARIAEHYLGKASEFSPALKRPYKVMLEVSHGHILAIGLMLITLTHLVIFVPGRGGLKALLISATFLSALANEGAGWLIRYYGAGWAPFKLAMFWTFQACLGLVILLLTAALFLNWRNDYSRTDPTRQKARHGAGADASTHEAASTPAGEKTLE